jgi:hypothetical protein
MRLSPKGKFKVFYKIKNMKTRLSLLLALIMLCASCINKSDGEHAYNEYCSSFFFTYEEKGIVDAVDFIFSTNDFLNQNSIDEIAELKNQLVSTTSLLGNFTGYELIANRAVGSNLRLLSYLIKYEKQPLRFTFVFYKPEDNWVIQNFSFDGNLIEELEESARVYLLNVYNENK